MNMSAFLAILQGAAKGEALPVLHLAVLLFNLLSNCKLALLAELKLQAEAG